MIAEAGFENPYTDRANLNTIFIARTVSFILRLFISRYTHAKRMETRVETGAYL